MQSLPASRRALRRHHRERLKRKRKAYWFWGTPALTEEQLGKVLHTPKTCSCWMCGNPRKYFKDKTIQEQKFELKANADLTFA